MKLNRNHRPALLIVLGLLSQVLTAAALPAAWQFEQTFTVSAAGVVKLALPVETLNAARPGLEDLRIYGPDGGEIPFWLAHPQAVPAALQRPKSFHPKLSPSASVLLMETGADRPVEGLILQTPATSFLKPVRVEGSHDRDHWTLLADEQPIFRQADGIEELDISFSPTNWEWLKVTIDDRSSPAIPFIGALLECSPITVEPTPNEWMEASITDRQESPGTTRLTVNLGAANLALSALAIESSTPLFIRKVTVSAPEFFEGTVREHIAGAGIIFRVAIAGERTGKNSIVPIPAQIQARELEIDIHNGDSPPLDLQSVRIKRRIAHLLFYAPAPGSYYLLTGNSNCPPPVYDVGALSTDAQATPVFAGRISPPQENPAFHAPEVLPGVESEGADLDPTEWRFRREVEIPRTGPQQLELDLNAVAHAQAGWPDLRLVHERRQIPFIIDNYSLVRSTNISVTATTEEKGISRWTLPLPVAGLPATTLTCTSATVLFNRHVYLYEETIGRDGNKIRHDLGEATWDRTPDRAQFEFLLRFNNRPTGDQVILETQNGDNQAIRLGGFRLFYDTPRLLFKSATSNQVFLYYGNTTATAPQYDLSLAGRQLIEAAKVRDTLGPEEQLKPSPSQITAGTGSLALWGALALVVVILLWIVARLLPKPAGS